MNKGMDHLKKKKTIHLGDQGWNTPVMSWQIILRGRYGLDPSEVSSSLERELLVSELPVEASFWDVSAIEFTVRKNDEKRHQAHTSCHIRHLMTATTLTIQEPVITMD